MISSPCPVVFAIASAALALAVAGSSINPVPCNRWTYRPSRRTLQEHRGTRIEISSPPSGRGCSRRRVDLPRHLIETTARSIAPHPRHLMRSLRSSPWVEGLSSDRSAARPKYQRSVASRLGPGNNLAVFFSDAQCRARTDCSDRDPTDLSSGVPQNPTCG